MTTIREIYFLIQYKGLNLIFGRLYLFQWSDYIYFNEMCNCLFKTIITPISVITRRSPFHHSIKSQTRKEMQSSPMRVGDREFTGRYGYESNADIKGTFAKLCIEHEKFPWRTQVPTSTGCIRRFTLSCMLNDGKREGKTRRAAGEQPAVVWNFYQWYTTKSMSGIGTVLSTKSVARASERASFHANGSAEKPSFILLYYLLDICFSPINYIDKLH